ncbi:MAG TPA: purine-nucleoside phosphorylase [Membranihabitans sp.]|nr:purine-nucleoside phosphorylase [Membranihabitans sp.]
MIPFHFRIWEAADFIRKQINDVPRHAVFLGTGLKDITNEFEITNQIPLRSIPHFPTMTVKHMDATLYVALIRDVPTWIIGGRLHYYEGYSIEAVTFPVRMMADAGTEAFFFTNAAGNVNPEWRTGDLVLIHDHINWSFPSPLRGENRAEWGDRYPIMEDVYTPSINSNLLNFATQQGIRLHTGVYLGLTGPQLETTAEYRLFRKLGADMIGMSTIPEVIVAGHMKRHVTGLSVLSNDASGVQISPARVEDMLKTIREKNKEVTALIRHWASLDLISN